MELTSYDTTKGGTDTSARHKVLHHRSGKQVNVLNIAVNSNLHVSVYNVRRAKFQAYS